MSEIRIGILGYGNLGRGVELAIRQNADMRLVALFTRRDPSSLTPLTEGVPVYSADSLPEHTADIDVLVLCGGSATDLPEQTPRYASLYNVVDSFDTHANIPQHFANVDAAAKEGGKVAVISGGIRACSPSHACTRTAFCRKARITRSGAAAFPRAIPTPFAAFRALRTLVSTPFRFPPLSRQCVRAKTLS